MNELNQFLEAHGFRGVVPSFDGQYQRVDRAGPLTGWLRGLRGSHAGRDLLVLECGDWKTGERYTFRSGCSDLSEADRQAAMAELDRVQAQARSERRARQEEVAEQMAKRWDQAIARGSTPYLARKGIHELGPARIHPDRPEVLWVPAWDIHGKLWGIQAIGPEGDKLFAPGMRVRGLFCVFMHPGRALSLTLLHGQHPVYLCEGYATGASIHAAVGGEAVLACFNASNLPAVAAELLALYPQARLVLCADNDAWTRRPGGAPWNPGVEAAQKAARLGPGAGFGVRWPEFGPLPDGVRLTDFNDLQLHAGLDAVRAQLQEERSGEPPYRLGESPAPSPLPPPPPDQSPPPPGGPEEPAPQAPPFRMRFFGDQDFEPLAISIGKNGKPVHPSQQRVVSHLLQHFQGRLIKQDRDLFLYQGTHWRRLELNDEDELRNLIQRVCQGGADLKLIRAAFELLVYQLPTPPPGVRLYRPDPRLVNFRNGTLRLLRNPDMSWRKEFGPHQMGDYLLNVLPYDYRPGDQERNPEFDQWLARCFEGDADAADKIRLAKQILGACLVQVFPQCVLCHGVPGTGKSTFIKVACRLVAPENLCSVAPADLEGFNLDTMAGKLLNAVTDISLTRPIVDDQIKMIVDRLDFTIRRKFKTDLRAPLPAVHVWGANGVPKTLDDTGAHDRRWSFLGFNRPVPREEQVGDFEQWLFQQGAQGILNTALEGLEDLMSQGGKFTQPASSAEAKGRWQTPGADVVEAFLRDIEEGEVSDQNAQVFRGPEGEMSRVQVWEVFCTWYESAFGDFKRPSKNVVFKALRQAKIEEKIVRGVRKFVGIGARGSQGAHF